MKMKQNQILLTVLTVLLILLIGLNSLVYGFRADLTFSRAYSLSSVTKQTVREIPEHLNITYYLSSKLKDRVPVFGEIEDTVREYASVSKGKISVEVIDSDKLGASQELAQKGLMPLQISENNVTEFSRSVAYSGLILSYMGEQSVIPAVTQTETLEYDLDRRIKELVYKEERKIGLLPLTPGLTADNQLALLNQVLGALYTVEVIEPERKIDSSFNAVVVIGETASAYQQLVLDQYLLRGGALLMLVDRHQTQLSPYGMSGSAVSGSAVSDWLEACGVRVEEELLLDTSCNAALMPTGRAFSIVQYPYFVKIPGTGGNRNHPVTASFNGLNLLWASPLTLTEAVADNGKVNALTLVQTTDGAWTAGLDSGIDFDQAVIMAAGAENQLRASYSVAVALSGEFDSYFKGKALPERPGEESEFPQPLGESSAVGRILAVGDSDFAVIDQRNQMTVQLYNLFSINLDQNFTFIQNAVEWLTADEDLLQLRTRVQRNTQLDQIQDPEARRAYFIFVQVFVLAVVPLCIIVFGGVRIFLRKRRAGKGGSR